MIYQYGMMNACPKSIALKSPLAAAARSFLRNGCKKAKMHTISSQRNCIWNVLSPPVPIGLPEIVFWHTFSHIFLHNLILGPPSSGGILTWENFYSSSFLLCSTQVTLDKSLFFFLLYLLWNVLFIHPQKQLLLIYSWDSPDCVPKHCSFRP